MPSRTLREGLTASDKVAAMEPGPQDRFPRYFLAADDFGCFRLQPDVIKGRIYSRRPDMTPDVVADDLAEFERVGCLLTWADGEKTFAWFTGWWEHNRQPRNDSVRKTPIPPDPASLSRAERSRGTGQVALPLRPAADPRPQFAVRSSQFAHAEEPPIAPQGGQQVEGLRVLKNTPTVEPVRLQKRKRVLSLAEQQEARRQSERDQRSKALHAWLEKRLAPEWDETTQAMVQRPAPERDEQLAWVQENCHASPEAAADAVALVAAAVEVPKTGARNGHG